MEDAVQQNLKPSKQGDPVSTIEEAFLARKAKNAQYSLRSFARDLGTSPGHLSRVLNRKRSLTRREASKMGIALNFSKPAINAFVRSVILSAPENAKIPKVLKDKIKNSAASSINKMTQYSVERFKAISQWYHMPILELTYVDHFTATDQWIAKELGISSIEVRDALKRLIELGLLEKCESRGLKKTTSQLFIDSNAEPEVRKYELAMIDKATTQYAKTSGEGLKQMLVNSICFPVSEELIPEIRKEIFEFQRKVMRLARGKSYDQVYQMNCQLFPITNSNKKGTKK